jgi:hypothetical protein
MCDHTYITHPCRLPTLVFALPLALAACLELVADMSKLGEERLLLARLVGLVDVRLFEMPDLEDVRKVYVTSSSEHRGRDEGRARTRLVLRIENDHFGQRPAPLGDPPGTFPSLGPPLPLARNENRVVEDDEPHRMARSVRCRVEGDHAVVDLRDDMSSGCRRHELGGSFDLLVERLHLARVKNPEIGHGAANVATTLCSACVILHLKEGRHRLPL